MACSSLNYLALSSYFVRTLGASGFLGSAYYLVFIRDPSLSATALSEKAMASRVSWSVMAD